MDAAADYGRSGDARRGHRFTALCDDVKHRIRIHMPQGAPRSTGGHTPPLSPRARISPNKRRAYIPGRSSDPLPSNLDIRAVTSFCHPPTLGSWLIMHILSPVCSSSPLTLLACCRQPLLLSSPFALVVTHCTHMIGWPSPCRKPSRLCSAHPHPDITPRQLLVRCAAVYEPCSRPTIHPCPPAPPPSPPRTVSPLLGWQRSPTPSAVVLLLGGHRRREHARHQLMHATHSRLSSRALSTCAGNPALIHIQGSCQNDVCARAPIL